MKERLHSELFTIGVACDYLKHQTNIPEIIKHIEAIQQFVAEGLAKLDNGDVEWAESVKKVATVFTNAAEKNLINKDE